MKCNFFYPQTSTATLFQEKREDLSMISWQTTILLKNTHRFVGRKEQRGKRNGWKGREGKRREMKWKARERREIEGKEERRKGEGKRREERIVKRSKQQKF